MKKELLEIKKRLVALALASTFTLPLSGCVSKYNNGEFTKYELVVFEEDRAIIICPMEYTRYKGETVYYVTYLYDGIETHQSFPVATTYEISHENDNDMTAEEFVKNFKGEDFPIIYLGREDSKTR